MPKWLTILLQVLVAAGSVAGALQGTKSGAAVVAAGSVANALLRSPVESKYK